MSGSIVRKDDKIGLKQLFDEESSTFTYLVWDTQSMDAVIVDPVDIQSDRDIDEVQNLGLKLRFGGTYVNELNVKRMVTFTHCCRIR